jgi:hypothetical protein
MADMPMRIIILLMLFVASTFGFTGCNGNRMPSTSVSGQDGKTLTIINELDVPVTLYFSVDFGRHFGHKCTVDANGTAQSDISDWVWLVDSLVDSGEEMKVVVVGVFPDGGVEILDDYTWDELVIKQYIVRLTKEVPAPALSSLENEVHFKTIAEAQVDTPFTIIIPKYIPSSLKLDDICIHYYAQYTKVFYNLLLTYRSPNSWVSISEYDALKQEWEFIPYPNRQLTLVTYGDIQVTEVVGGSRFSFCWNTPEVGIDIDMNGVSEFDADAIVKSMIL